MKTFWGNVHLKSMQKHEHISFYVEFNKNIQFIEEIIELKLLVDATHSTVIALTEYVAYTFFNEI